MGDIIEVNFKKKEKVQKYVLTKHICIICFNSVLYDSIREDNEPFIELNKSKGQCICKECSVEIKGIVDENKWDV